MCSLASQQAVVGALARMASIVAKLLANRGYCRGLLRTRCCNAQNNAVKPAMLQGVNVMTQERPMNKHNKATLSATGASYGTNPQRHNAANHAGQSQPCPVNADNPDTLLLGCKKLVGQRLKNHRGEVLGTLDSIVLDLKTGRISYAVLAYPSSFVAPPRLFALPWHALVLDDDQHHFSVEAEHSELQRQPGFDRALWPAMADPQWQRKVNGFYSSD